VIVIDASALIELLMLTPAGLTMADRILELPQTLHAPELIDLEVAQVVRRFVALGDVTEERATAMLDDLGAIRMRRYPHLPLVARVWELRHNLTAYDAAYVALAEGLEATVWTRDKALEVAPHRARVEIV
jgi:predicted nucleic acid-binding protein